MPKVTYQTDQGPKVINFGSMPTQADIEDVAKQQGWKPKGAQAPTPGATPDTASNPGGINLSDINAPAYDMGQNNSGLLGTVGKESANIVKSGVKFGKGIVDFFNPIETAKKVAQIPGAVGGYFHDLGGAAQSEALAQQMEAKVKATTGKKPVAGPTDITSLAPDLTKAAYETVVPEAIKSAFKGNFTEALTSAANDPFQFAPLLLAAKELPGGEAKLDAGVAKVKETVGGAADVVKTKAAEAYAKVPESMKPTGTGIAAVDNFFQGKPLETQIGELDATIKKGLDKGVKPTVVGKRTLGQREAFYEKSANAVKTIADLKDQLKITDETGAPVEGAPKTVAQGAQATDQGLKLVWKKSAEIMKNAGEEGAAFDPTETVAKLKTIQSDIGNSPEVRATAKSFLPEVRELKGADPETVATRLAEYNKRLQGLYNGTTKNAEANVLASIADKMRGSMDASIESVLEKSGNQTLRNQYGELKALDKEMQHRATVVGRQAPKSLFGGITDAGAIAELARGIMTMNPADLASSVAIKGLGEYIKKLNSPDANVAKMFDAAYKAKDAAQAQGFNSLRDLTPDVIKMANKATDLTKANGGVTISLKGEVPTEGFSVATDKLTEHTVPQETFSKSDTLSYIAKNFDKLKTEGNYIGAWIDNGKVYLDVPSVFKDVKQAVKAAKAADQLGIFDLSKFETIGKENYEKIIGNDKTRAPGDTRTVQRKTVGNPQSTGTGGRAGKAKSPSGAKVVGSGMNIGSKVKARK